MKKLFVNLLALLISSSAGAFTIEDPQQIIDETQNFLANRSFKKEFVIGDSITRVTNNCTQTNDEVSCTKEITQQQVKKVTAQAAFYSDNYAISKKRYEAIDRNILNMMFETEEISSFLGQQKIQFSEMIVRFESYDEGYNETLNSPIMTIKLTFLSQDEGFEFPMYIVLGQSLPFAGQIVEIGLDPQRSNWPMANIPLMKVIDWVKFL